jgi:phosphoglucosamine mutase
MRALAFPTVTRLFGTDGVRGRYGRELTDDLAFALGRAVVDVLDRDDAGRIRVVVGRDTRSSGVPLERALVEGITAGGADAVLAGIVPTPAVAFLTTHLGVAAGAVISASHNPADDNGIKFFGGEGFKLSDELEDEIERLVRDGGHRVAPSPGTATELEGEIEAYLEHVVAAADAPLAGMRIVVDCANGAAYRVAPEILRRLGADVEPIFDRPDGSNINDGCGALHPEVVARAVVDHGADAGLALDGDADRALFADAGGAVIDGDQVLAACALAMHDDGRLPGDVVVSTVMANLGLREAIGARGIELVATKVGDRYVLEEMLARGAALGGEQSGHVIFREHATTGDGLLTAVRFLSIAAKRGLTLAGLASAMRRFPQALVNVPVEHKERLEGNEEIAVAIDRSEGELGPSGRILVRASGTEPLVRVMVEAESEDQARRHAEALAETVRAALG